MMINTLLHWFQGVILHSPCSWCACAFGLCLGHHVGHRYLCIFASLDVQICKNNQKIVFFCGFLCEVCLGGCIDCLENAKLRCGIGVPFLSTILCLQIHLADIGRAGPHLSHWVHMLATCVFSHHLVVIC